MTATDPDDLIPVRVTAADGPTIVLHTREEYDRLWAGVDRGAAIALAAFDAPEAR